MSCCFIYHWCYISSISYYSFPFRPRVKTVSSLKGAVAGLSQFYATFQKEKRHIVPFTRLDYFWQAAFYMQKCSTARSHCCWYPCCSYFWMQNLYRILKCFIAKTVFQQCQGLKYRAFPLSFIRAGRCHVKPVCVCARECSAWASAGSETPQASPGLWGREVGVVFEPHILNTLATVPWSPAVIGWQPGGWIERKTNIATGSASLCRPFWLPTVLARLGSDTLSPPFSPNPLRRFRSPRSHEDHCAGCCHSDVVRDGGGRRREASERFQPADGETDTHTHTYTSFF